MTNGPIKQIAPALGGEWFALWAVSGQPEPYALRPIACWGLFEDGNVEGMVADDGPVSNAEAILFSETTETGFVRYVHARELSTIDLPQGAPEGSLPDLRPELRAETLRLIEGVRNQTVAPSAARITNQ